MEEKAEDFKSQGSRALALRWNFLLISQGTSKSLTKMAAQKKLNKNDDNRQVKVVGGKIMLAHSNTYH